jgi:hypothetical protein
MPTTKRCILAAASAREAIGEDLVRAGPANWASLWDVTGCLANADTAFDTGGPGVQQKLDSKVDVAARFENRLTPDAVVDDDDDGAADGYHMLHEAFLDESDAGGSHARAPSEDAAQRRPRDQSWDPGS